MGKITIRIDPDLHLPVYQHLENDDGIDIDFLWGSRDSGKSREVAMRLVESCLSASYFRFILARKTFNTIKDSQWQVIKDVVEEWGLSHLFTFKISPLEIHCINGNKFIARGFDDAQKIKSVQNPSGAWVEELNELSQDDWIVLTTSLRTNLERVKIWGSFNPESDEEYNDFWLFKQYFADEYPHTLSFTKDIISKTLEGKSVKIRYRSTHTTYANNPYCDPKRIAIYEALEKDNPYYHTVYARGLWGKKLNIRPFAYAFDAHKHVIGCTYDPRNELCLSFDFNVDPITCIAAQHTGIGNGIKIIKEYRLENSDIYELCSRIKADFPKALILVTGDASGAARSALTRGNINYYQVIRQELGLGSGQMRQPSINPAHKDVRVLINSLLSNTDLIIDPSCKFLIQDCRYVEANDEGGLDKSKEKTEAKIGHLFQAWYYYLNTFHAKFLKMI